VKCRAPWGVLLAIFVLTACGPGELFEDSSEKATREAQNEIYSQTIVYVETQVTTLEALKSTAESASVWATQIVQLGAQNQALLATLEAASLGISSSSQPQPPAGQPAGQTPIPANSALFPQTGNVQQPASTTTVYTNATTSTAVNDDDGCASDSVTDFDTAEDQVYMVVTAQNLDAGITYYVRWSHANQIFSESVTWTSDAFYPQLCIWFYMEAEGRFPTGAWTVELVANELPVISRSFRVGQVTNVPNFGTPAMTITPAQ
jgi:hypothetical protein